VQAIGLFNMYMSNPHLKEDLFPKSKKKTDITIPRQARATFHCHLNKRVSPIPVILKARKEMWLIYVQYFCDCNFIHPTQQDNC